MVRKVVFAFPLVLSILLCYVESRGTPFVDTQNGRILGRTIEVTPWQIPDSETIVVEAYTKIPYAESPVGELRYKHPVKKVWTGEVDATKPNVACPQVPLIGFIVEMEETEDCLYLDVFVPSPRPNPAPVMVWIHGGGFFAGAGSVPEQLPIPLSFYGEVIVVTFNYRLGMLGFLNTGDGEIPANLGMFDQREALKWVQENIAAFGGDPGRVTIFGESAGGASVNFHLLSPLSAGLFRGAILQSGNALLNMGNTDLVEKTFEFGKGAGCDFNNSKDLAECLRGRSLEDLKDGYIIINVHPGHIEFAPVVDGHFLNDTPLKLMQQGHVNVDNVLHGDLLNEGSCFTIFTGFASTEDIPPPVLTLDDFKNHLANFFMIDDPLILDTIVFVLSDSAHITGNKTDYFKELADAFDSIISCPINPFSNLLSTAGKTAYRYTMTHAPSHSALGPLKWAGATHVEDIPYVFGSPLLREREDGPKGMSGFFDGAEEAALSRQIMRYWSNFAKTGNPNLSSQDPKVVNNPLDLEEWQPFTNEQPYYKELDYGFPTREGVMKAKECHFWTTIFPKMMAQSFELSMLKTMLADQVAAHSTGTCDGDSCPEQ
ncbi:cholinesterase 1 [Strongylocentrotus purpuratus]|uniref:Carboxylic ester hydrolase n=1 Tax=Strongylocentrotus purpuratus TaxID=7668 RepID=A0A7M7RDB1_STRPU|nr:cholinesterase 1 [Strongylocentrotus purpuratus]